MEISEAFLEAESLAEKAAQIDEVPVGAIVLLEGKIIGSGYNLRESQQNPVAHAEIMAIQNAAQNIQSWRLLHCELVVTLEPCPMCLAAAQQARIKKVYYGAKDQKGGALSLGYALHQDARTNHRFEVEWVERERSGTILKEFFRKRRKELSSDEN